MSTLEDGGITIFEALQNVERGKYVMPAFQRQYVWSMEQIEKLWDSILLDYPISTFLFWHLDKDNVASDAYFCEFLPEATFNHHKQSDESNYRTGPINIAVTDIAILDGQQRLTSLYLSLYGSTYLREKYARRVNSSKTKARLFIELNKHRLPLDESEYNSKKFAIGFTDRVVKLSPTQFEIKRILDPTFQNKDSRGKAIEDVVSSVPSDSKDYARQILNKLCEKIFEERLIRYTEIKGMGQDDALEMFVRFNSGGKALKKSEITMSILEAYWPSARTEFGKVLIGQYEGYGTDFVIRAALMLYGDVVKSGINMHIATQLRNGWNQFRDSLSDLEELLGSMHLGVRHFAKSWNVLLPIIYLINVNPNYERNREGIAAYLARAVLFTYFRSGTTSKLQRMKNAIRDYGYELTVDLLDQINELMVTEGKVDDILNAEKGSRIAGEALALLGASWTNKNLRYQQDHLHPYSEFEKAHMIGVSDESWLAWRSKANRLPNLQLLEGRSNGSKSSMSLAAFYSDMNDEQQRRFRAEALIPDGVSLELASFDDFYEKRRALLARELRRLLRG